MIPLHATATAHPPQLRWVVAADRLPPRGTVRTAPGKLGALLDTGILDGIVVEPSGILITIGAGHTWRELGDDVRAALSAALAQPDSWAVDQSFSAASALEAVAAELLNGQVGSLAASHCGSIELVSVAGHRVTVRLSGVCHGCPGASATLRNLLESELRHRVDPRMVVVASESDSSALSFVRRLLSLLVR
ncbi:NifU family protein [Mycobacterium tilburgii]|uniref:NifU family protein n=1 Tax=Mycobacterium tilburgii TaxID=44467 RepID=UPI001184349D|nr:NifU family protein [Mycobacterium tilburgii]